MKNNTLAMLAIISIALSFASLVGYIEPGTCTVDSAQGLPTCDQAATERFWGFVGLFSFGVITLVVGTVRSRLSAKKDSQEA